MQGDTVQKQSVWLRLKEKLPQFFRAVFAWCSRLVWVFPPLIVLFATLSLFKANGLYPFGNQTISWGDMDQQVIPLLLNFKDILQGKDGFLFSFKNAGGMNFYGVFFFFLSSPFSFLVVFVDKSNVAGFMNVLVMLKMCTAALTASVYFQQKHRDMSLLNVFLSVLYAYSGYVMMYYQIISWLDVVYLFPLLLLGLEKLQEGKRALFTIMLAICMIVNYYIGYMIVVFLLLYAFVWLLLSGDKKFAINFVLSCALAALLSAIVWLPSLWQYFASGRTTEIIKGLKNSAVLTSYQTAWPTVFSIAFLFPFALARKENETKDMRLRLVLFLLTCVPIVFEPIAKMWQTGSYMCFPTRFSFMTIFLCLSLAMDGMVKLQTKPIENTLSWKEKFLQNWKKTIPMYALSGGLLLITICYYFFARGYTQANFEVMDQYSHSLWGNAQSFDALVGLYALAVVVGVAWFVLCRFKLCKTILMWVAVGVMVLSELYVGPMTYMLTPAHEVTKYQEAVELADVIDDESFFRVKSDREYSGRDFDATLMGGLGYNALGHFTSLTRENYMTSIKRFGYTSYWMEVGNSGGTLLSDALMSVKYQISDKKTTADVYNGTYYHIAPTTVSLPLGVITKKDIIALEENRAYDKRGEMQQILEKDFFDTNGVTVYGMNDATAHHLTVEEENGKYLLKPTSSAAKLTFDIPVSALTTIYFNAFDENTNALKQAINDKFSVKGPNYSLSTYPTQKRNGILRLGEYSNRTVTVEIGVKSEVRVKELCVIGIETQTITQAANEAKSVGLTAEKNRLTGNYKAKGGECVFLSVAYDQGMRLTINGKKAELYEVYDGFTAFYLQPGDNDIKISFTPKGFVLGTCITAIGVGLSVAVAVLWIWKKRRLQTPVVLDMVAYYGLLAAGVGIICVIYIAPMILCLL